MVVVVDRKTISQRVDKYISDLFSNMKMQSILLSRSFIANHISEFVKLNGLSCKKGVKLNDGDILDIDIRKFKNICSSVSNERSGQIVSQKGSLDIIYETDSYIVINKKKGLVMHPGVGNSSNTLVNFLRYYLEMKGEYDSGIERGGIVHRLDKGVSGLVVVAKNVVMQKKLQSQFEAHEVVKIYRATVDKDISDLNSETDIKTELDHLQKKDFSIDGSWEKVEGVIARDKNNRKRMKFTKGGRGKYCLMYIKGVSKRDFLIRIVTGRMHQIRAGLKFLGYGIVGDTLYNGSSTLPSEISLESVLLGVNIGSSKREVWRLI